MNIISVGNGGGTNSGVGILWFKVCWILVVWYKMVMCYGWRLLVMVCSVSVVLF